VSEMVQVETDRVTVALGRYRLALEQKTELMQEIGMSMLVSIRRTFRQKGSPAGSWAPLAPSTIKSNPKKYGPGHQLLIGKGTLLNSIGFHTQPGQVVIGTNLKYAAVHQYGSRDRGPVAIGPRTRAMQDATINVKEHSYRRLSAGLGVGSQRIVNAKGRAQIVRRKIAGPRNATLVSVRSHGRHQNIPARPYLVFRPEDPRRIQSLVNTFCRNAASKAGLGGEA
jgi:phage virion morphogenesis protein